MSSTSSDERMSSHNVDSMSSMTDPDDEDSEVDEAPSSVTLEGAPQAAHGLAAAGAPSLGWCSICGGP
eukprot:11219319-Heterocapsa_arctica.AAC.1